METQTISCDLGRSSSLNKREFYLSFIIQFLTLVFDVFITSQKNSILLIGSGIAFLVFLMGVLENINRDGVDEREFRIFLMFIVLIFLMNFLIFLACVLI